MFGVLQVALLVLFVGCSTLAITMERNQRYAELQVEVVKQVPQCEQKTIMDDDIMVSIATRGEIGSHVVQGFPYVHIEFKLGESPLVLLDVDEALLGMCPGEIRRLKYALDEKLGNESPIIIYDVELENIGTDSGSVVLLPPDIDINGDGDKQSDELDESLRTALYDFLSRGSPSYNVDVFVDRMFILLAGYLYEF